MGMSADARRVIGAGETGRGQLGQATECVSPVSPARQPAGPRWRGRTYVVDVGEGGLIYDGECFSSLSVIAGKITGTRWSGPKFFGLVA